MAERVLLKSTFRFKSTIYSGVSFNTCDARPSVASQLRPLAIDCERSHTDRISNKHNEHTDTAKTKSRATVFTSYTDCFGSVRTALSTDSCLHRCRDCEDAEEHRRCARELEPVAT